MRAFRILLVKDGLLDKKLALRTAQVTVWDADSMETDALREGKKYLVRDSDCIEISYSCGQLGCESCTDYGPSVGQIRHRGPSFLIHSARHEMDSDGLIHWRVSLAKYLYFTPSFQRYTRTAGRLTSSRLALCPNLSQSNPPQRAERDFKLHEVAKYPGNRHHTA